MRLKLQTCLTFRRDAEERLLLLGPAVSSSAVLKSCTSWSMLCTSSLSVSLAGIISCPRYVNECDPSSDLDRGGGGGRGAEPEDSVSVGRHAGQTELRELDGQASVLHTGTRCK